MNDPVEICSTVLSCLHDFQTLVAGVLAVLSAVLAGRWVLRAARLPVEVEMLRVKDGIERQRVFTCVRLSGEFTRVSEHARQARGTIQVTISSQTDVTDNTRAKTTIPEPPLLDDWESMSLLSKQAVGEVMGMRANLRRHNFDMARAGGSFGDDNFQQHVLKQADQLHSSAKHVAGLLANEANRTEVHQEVP